MPLFKRKEPQSGSLPIFVERPTWMGRLTGIGAALDAVDHAMRDIVIITEGGPDEGGAFINMLGHRQSAFRSIWATVMYEMAQGEQDLTDYATGAAVANRPLTAPDAGSSGPWETRFRAIGALLDQMEVTLRSVTVIDLDDGVVVNALVRTSDFATTSTLCSFEFSNLQIQPLAPAVATSAHARSIAR